MLGSGDLVVLLAVVATVQAQCTSGQFRCGNGRCVSSSVRCNGYAGGCTDGSDERGCSSCQSGAFLCSNGQCIRTSDRCDGTRDCTDGSDETGCTQCSSSQFRCDNGQCVSSSVRCNGLTGGCSDGSDERGCSANSGELRLAQGTLTRTFYTSGRLEIYLNGQWGTVCDDSWDSTNSDVACRQLGYFRAARPTSYRPSSSAGFGSGTGQIWLDDVHCRGSESHLTSCSNRGIGSHNCIHSEDVAIYCTALRSGDLRLARGSLNSTSYTSGRLEIYLSGQWGTVCNDFWDATNSRVACRQLGFSSAVSPFYGTSSSVGFGFGTGQIWLDNVNCRGTESRLTSCSNSGTGIHDCSHFGDVAVYCSGTISSCLSSQFPCTTSGSCISSSSRCDGFRSCTDGSDEMDCISCSSGAFRCNNRQCIRSTNRCDGTRECTDGSDETGCFSCSGSSFRCSTGSQCIPFSGRCNGIRECTDGSDETSCSDADARLASQVGRQAGTTVGVIIGISFLICLIWVPMYLMCTHVSVCPLFRPYMAKPTLNVPPPTTDALQYEETSFSTTPSTQHHVNEGQDEAP